METKEVEISKVICNDWNPNEMSGRMQEILTDNMKRMGMIDPILVTADKDNLYRIIDGEHRFKIAVGLGYEKIPVVIIDKDISEVEQKKQTVRLNQIKGQIGYERFNKLVNKLLESGTVNEEVLAFELGFESEADLKLLYTGYQLAGDDIMNYDKSVSNDIRVSNKLLNKQIERYLKSKTPCCIIVVPLDTDVNLVTKFEPPKLKLLLQAKQHAESLGVDFESWLLQTIMEYEIYDEKEKTE